MSMILTGMKHFIPATRPEETNGPQQPKWQVQIEEVCINGTPQTSSSLYHTAFGTVDHDLHRKRRAANSRLHSTAAIASAEVLVRGQVERLSSIFRNAFETGEVLELRTRFLAFTTDTVALYSLGESLEYLSSRQRSEEWGRTIRAVAGLTPLVKQFPWLIDIVKSIPLAVATRIMPPDLARVSQFHYVSNLSMCNADSR